MIDKKQIPPAGDLRYRVHRSVKCYLAKMECGTEFCTWNFDDSIERIVYVFPDKSKKVVYNNSFYKLESPERMAEVIGLHLADKGAVNLLGKSLYYGGDRSYTPYHFIDITSEEDKERYLSLREAWLCSESFKRM